MENMQGVVGIDEVGRGPVAGPVTVGAVLWLVEDDPTSHFSFVQDSKKLSHTKRMLVKEEMERKQGKELYSSVSSIDSDVIDEKGIMFALLAATTEALEHIAHTHSITHILSDYGLPIPKEYSVTHIVHGDEKEPLISLASIIAKETRDAIMVDLGNKYPGYTLEKNKGYFTKEHKEGLTHLGMSAVHRKSFLRGYDFV